MSSNPEREDQGVVAGKRAIIRIDPAIAERTIFQNLATQVMADEKIGRLLDELSKLKAGPEQVAAMVHVIMRQNVGTLLGHLIPPQTGWDIIKDRIVQSATIILDMLKEEVDRIELEIEQAMREGQKYKVQENVRTLIQRHLIGLIAIREVMNRYFILYTMNLPADMRPPLMEVKLGMDVV